MTTQRIIEASATKSITQSGHPTITATIESVGGGATGAITALSVNVTSFSYVSQALDLSSYDESKRSVLCEFIADKIAATLADGIEEIKKVVDDPLGTFNLPTPGETTTGATGESKVKLSDKLITEVIQDSKWYVVDESKTRVTESVNKLLANESVELDLYVQGASVGDTAPVKYTRESGGTLHWKGLRWSIKLPKLVEGITYVGTYTDTGLTITLPPLTEDTTEEFDSNTDIDDEESTDVVMRSGVPRQSRATNPMVPNFTIGKEGK